MKLFLKIHFRFEWILVYSMFDSMTAVPCGAFLLCGRQRANEDLLFH